MPKSTKKCDLSDFDWGMIVGARQGGLSISETADLLGFSEQNLCREGCEKQKTFSEQQFCGKKVMLMSEVRREGSDWSKLTGR